MDNRFITPRSLPAALEMRFNGRWKAAPRAAYGFYKLYTVDIVFWSGWATGPAASGLSAMISQKAKYALRALVALARRPAGSATFIGDIAESQGIPKKFLEQILLDLKRHGLVVSRRGKAGGYGLLRPADMISFGEVLRIVDGPIAPLPCLSKIAYRRCDDCEDEASCEVRRVFARVADATRDVLDRTTIADALDDRLPRGLRNAV